ncbi:enhanced serine sensitivity protein SseB C-terminal domain-containing protein [Bacillus sp. REN3]|uniref:enhanced serine sensitivity protein SseB C-terminal domain-containing protein n=1 Tax=Bacillus sp. REN3 TaxID=2802440 RepID=UPI001AED72A9|nr:enhanced serine sensitivity protein SseB C-terminal domain-containing protein [Bacillus sp. REN3]
MSVSFDELLAAAVEGPSGRFLFYRALVELELFVIGSVADDETLSLRYIEEDGELVLPVFTSREKFDEIFKSEYPYVRIQAELLLEMAGTDIPWLVNPFTGLSKKIIREELETLKDGRILNYFFEQLSDEEKERILTELMEELPEEAMDVLRTCLKQFPTVKKAYLVNLFDPTAADEAFPLLAVEVEAVEEGLVGELFNAINHHAEPQVEVMILDESFPLATSIVGHTRPFYFRESVDELRTMFD